MGAQWSITVAAVFVWLGMVLAISFLEAPLKFRAPGVTLAVGLGIGRAHYVYVGYVYVGLEVVKVIALLAAGTLLLVH